MRKSKKYFHTRFSEKVIDEASSILLSLQDGLQPVYLRAIDLPGDESYEFDSDEEFFARYRNGFLSVQYRVHLGKDILGPDKYMMGLDAQTTEASVTVIAPTPALIEKVFSIFERSAESSRIPEPSPVVFIGHGHSPQWRDLKDHLHEQHDYKVETYETGARAGHTIQGVLQGMLNRSGFALLLLTAEDEMATGVMRPRENVVHEAGLFQGRLGFQRAIVLVEEGVEPFSNLQGINQIRYAKGNIRETYGDILATLRREFKQE